MRIGITAALALVFGSAAAQAREPVLEAAERLAAEAALQAPGDRVRFVSRRGTGAVAPVISFAQTAANPQNEVELRRLRNRGRQNRIWGGVALAVGGAAVMRYGASCVAWTEPPPGALDQSRGVCVEREVSGKMKAVGAAMLASGVSLSLWNVFKVSASPQEMRLTLEVPGL